MDIQKVRKLVSAGFMVCIGASIIGLLFGADNLPLKNSMLSVGVVSLLLTMGVIMKWARCPWCGASLLRGLFKIKVCPKCRRDLITGKKKKGKGGR